ncbi:MAG: hypothetical protein WB646_10295 [Steroidobacteraceae bacterium]
MREEELIALVAIIRDELAAANRHEDLKQLGVIFGDLLGPDKVMAYEALGDLQDRLADITNLPDHSSITAEEWDARRTDFCRAAELYLDARWKKPSGCQSPLMPREVL